MATKPVVTPGGLHFTTPDKVTKKQIQELAQKSQGLAEGYNYTATRLLKPVTPNHDQQLSPEDALYLTLNFEYPRQRNVSTAWAAELGTLIEEGKFTRTPIHLAHCKETGKTYVIDGYHRLTGLAMGLKPFTFPIIHHYCETMDEVDEIYCRLDQGLPRKMGAAVRATQFDAKMGLPEQFIEKVSTAAQTVDRGFRQPVFSERKRSSTHKMDIVEEWKNEARLIYNSSYGGDYAIVNPLRKAGFLSVCLAVARYQPQMARDFIRDIAHNECAPNTPGKTFISLLLSGKARLSNRNIAEHARLLASVWNAHFEGRQLLRVMGTQDPKRPMDLFGTPWAGPKIHQSGPNIGRIIEPYEQNMRKAERADFNSLTLEEMMPEE